MRFTRPKFCRAMKRFWDDFILDWNVLLNGNPAVDVFNGLKLAAGGELGIGVGEEEWGCGEREVLEDFIGRTDGLVDLMVARFGEASDLDPTQHQTLTSTTGSSSNKIHANEWQGAVRDSRPSDGVIFSGIGAITRTSIKAVSSWVELIYKYGKDAYGVRDNPSAIDRPKYNRPLDSRESRKHPDKDSESPPSRSSNPLSSEQTSPSDLKRRSGSSTGIPAPIVKPSKYPMVKTIDSEPLVKNTNLKSESVQDSASGTETLMKYLTLGAYGSKWGISTPKPNSYRSRTSEFAGGGPQSLQDQGESHGYFIIGLQGDLDQDAGIRYNHRDIEQSTDRGNIVKRQSWNNRTMIRTLHVERIRQKNAESSRRNLAQNGMWTSIIAAQYSE